MSHSYGPQLNLSLSKDGNIASTLRFGKLLGNRLTSSPKIFSTCDQASPKPRMRELFHSALCSPRVFHFCQSFFPFPLPPLSFLFFFSSSVFSPSPLLIPGKLQQNLGDNRHSTSSPCSSHIESLIFRKSQKKIPTKFHAGRHFIPFPTLSILFTIFLLSQRRSFVLRLLRKEVLLLS